MNEKSTCQIYLFFLIALLAFSCRDKKDVDVSHIKLNLGLERFDQEMNQLNPDNLSGKTSELDKKYGAFYDDYMEKMLSVGNTSDTSYYQNLRTVLRNQDYNALKEETASKFKDLNKVESELLDAFRHVKYYYPNAKIPRLITFISGFSVQTPIGNNYIGIGLDMFLGANSKFYPALRESIPLYISRRFTPENITPRVMETYIREEMFPEPENLNSLLDRMIHNGKIMYMMESVMPNLPDSLIIGYTSQQEEWCKNYESQIWGYFLENELLYETDYMKIQKFLAEAPFTPGIGEKNDSSPKLGIFTGWQIVRKYMDENPSMTVQDLMANTDYQVILNKSKYKPK